MCYGLVVQLVSTHTRLTHTHTFNGPFSGTTRVSQYQKGKTNLDFTEARDSEWQWHQRGHMQVCTSLQTDNHASTPPLGFFFQARCRSCRPTNSVKALKEKLVSTVDKILTDSISPGSSAVTELLVPFWYRLTRVVPEKGCETCVWATVNVCVCACQSGGPPTGTERAMPAHVSAGAEHRQRLRARQGAHDMNSRPQCARRPPGAQPTDPLVHQPLSRGLCMTSPERGLFR